MFIAAGLRSQNYGCLIEVVILNNLMEQSEVQGVELKGTDTHYMSNGLNEIGSALGTGS